MPMIVYTEEEVIEATDKAVADALKDFVEKCRHRFERLDPDIEDIPPSYRTVAIEGHRRGANAAYWAMGDVLRNTVNPID